MISAWRFWGFKIVFKEEKEEEKEEEKKKTVFSTTITCQSNPKARFSIKNIYLNKLYYKKIYIIINYTK